MLFITSSKEVMFSSVLVCLFVSSITQKLLYWYPQNLVECWHIGRGRNH